jgi:cytochrome c-type biogenesis protein CcmE
MIKITNTNRKRIVKISIFFFAISSFSALLIYAFSKNMVYFYTPTQIIEKEAPMNSFIRIGGMVKENSLVKSNDSLKVSFKIHDLEQVINITYDGILPDLFAEGQGVVMTGTLINKDTFIADEVLAKHDENYMPPEVADMMKEKNGVLYKK